MDAYNFKNLNFVEKLSLRTVENEDGSLDLIFEWDEKDPDMKEWTDLGSEKQKEFMLSALENAVKDCKSTNE